MRFANCEIFDVFSFNYLVTRVLQGVHFRPYVLQVGFRRFRLQNYFVHRNCKIDGINQL